MEIACKWVDVLIILSKLLLSEVDVEFLAKHVDAID